MVKNDVQNQSGFTLIETILYVALLSTFLVGALVATLSLVSANAHTIEVLERNIEAAFIEDKLAWALSNATAVTVSGNAIHIVRMPADVFSSSENPLVVYLENSNLLLKRASRERLVLNAQSYPIDSFAVDLSSNDSYKKIRVQFEIQEEFFDATYLIHLP